MHLEAVGFSSLETRSHASLEHKKRKKKKEKKGNRGNFSIHLGTPSHPRDTLFPQYFTPSRGSFLPASLFSIKMLMLNFNGIRLFRISREMMVEKLEGNFAKVYF